MHNMVRYAMYSLFVAAAIVAALTVFQMISLAVNQPVIMVVTGESMLPALKPFDIVFLQSVGEGVKVGDIAVVDYRDKNNLFSNYGFIVHRITKTWEKDGVEFVVTRGDNLKYSEYAISTSKVLAKVQTSVPFFGMLIWPPGNFIIIGAALMILIYSRRKHEQS